MHVASVHFVDACGGCGGMCLGVILQKANGSGSTWSTTTLIGQRDVDEREEASLHLAMLQTCKHVQAYWTAKLLDRLASGVGPCPQTDEHCYNHNLNPQDADY